MMYNVKSMLKAVEAEGTTIEHWALETLQLGMNFN